MPQAVSVAGKRGESDGTRKKAGMELVRILVWCCSPAGKTWQLITFARGFSSSEMALAEPGWVFGDMSRGCMCGREKYCGSLSPVSHLCRADLGPQAERKLFSGFVELYIPPALLFLWCFCSHSYH